MRFHTEVLEASQRSVLDQSAPLLASRGFVMGGGTALGLLLGHRKSIDFDWFLHDEMQEPLRLAASLKKEGLGLEDIQVEKGTLHARCQGVRLSLLEYLYPMLAEPIAWEERGCRILSLEDLSCMKLAAAAQRGSRKDLIDIFALVSRFRPLEELLDLYRRKYSVEDIGHVLFGLAYFDDAEQEAMPEMLWDKSWDEMKGQLQQWVRKAAG